jgi:dissimilatory sulfite reductase (desulfoviridin) alpha/beta subunit
MAYSLDKESQREYQLDAILNDKESYIDGKYCPTCGHCWEYLPAQLYPK